MDQDGEKAERKVDIDVVFREVRVKECGFDVGVAKAKVVFGSNGEDAAKGGVSAEVSSDVSGVEVEIGNL